MLTFLLFVFVAENHGILLAGFKPLVLEKRMFGLQPGLQHIIGCLRSNLLGGDVDAQGGA